MTKFLQIIVLLLSAFSHEIDHPAHRRPAHEVVVINRVS